MEGMEESRKVLKREEKDRRCAFAREKKAKSYRTDSRRHRRERKRKVERLGKEG